MKAQQVKLGTVLAFCIHGARIMKLLTEEDTWVIRLDLGEDGEFCGYASAAEIMELSDKIRKSVEMHINADASDAAH